MHGILLGVLFIIGGIILKLVLDGGNKGTGDYGNWLFLMISFALVMVAASIFLPNFIIKRIKKNRTSEAILRLYRAAYVLKYSLLIFPILVGFFGYLYFSNIAFFLTSCALALVMLAHKPHKRGVSKVIRA